MEHIQPLLRPALGAVASLGQLYDAGSDQFLDKNLFQDRIPAQFVNSTEKFSQDFRIIKNDELSGRFEGLEVYPELQASILAGLVGLEGCGRFLDMEEQQNSARAVRGSFLYAVRTGEEKLEFKDVICDGVGVDQLRGVKATHVVGGICWGANTIVSCLSSNDENCEKKEIRESILDALKYIAVGSTIKSQTGIHLKKVNDLKITIYGDVLSEGSSDPIHFSVEQSREFLQKIPNLVRVINGGKGKPVFYKLIPISKLTSVSNQLYSIPIPHLLRVVRYVEKTEKAKQYLNDLHKDVLKHPLCVPTNDIINIIELKKEVIQDEEKFRSKLAEIISSIRSGDCYGEEIDKLLGEFEDSGFSSKRLEKKMKEWKLIEETIRSESHMKKGGKYFDKAVQKIAKLYKLLVESEREESIQLGTGFASPKGKISPDGPGGKEFADDGDDETDVDLNLQTQKKIIQQLEMELQAEKQNNKDFGKQIKALEEQVERQSLEVGRLTSENVSLRDQVTLLKSEMRRRQEQNSMPNASLNTTGNFSDHASLDIKKQPQDYLGMLEYRQEDIGHIMRALIIDLQPKVALSAQPSGLPAFILFMMIRYTDYINDDNKVRSLLTSVITYIKRLMKQKCETLDVTVLWLSNILRLLHTLKQYSGDTAFQQENTPKQNDQRLKNFDLNEYRKVLSDHSVWIYMMLLKTLEQEIQAMIVPAVLEDVGIGSGGGGGGRGEKQKPLDSLIRKMDVTYNLLCSYGLDVEVINQVFRQLLYYVGAGALNNLLLRRELCNWSKGLDIRYNVSALEEWGRGKKMEEVVRTALNPVIQASKILQAKKSDNKVDVETICGFCENLTIQQVVQLLNLYSSKNGIDADKVSKTFIERVQSRLLSMRAKTPEQQEQLTKTKLLMDTQFTYAVKFPFNSSSVKLEEINIPESFGLDQWVTKK